MPRTVPRVSGISLPASFSPLRGKVWGSPVRARSSKQFFAAASISLNCPSFFKTRIPLSSLALVLLGLTSSLPRIPPHRSTSSNASRPTSASPLASPTLYVLLSILLLIFCSSESAPGSYQHHPGRFQAFRGARYSRPLRVCTTFCIGRQNPRQRHRQRSPIHLPRRSRHRAF